MVNCKHCGSTEHSRNGMVHGKQRYLCKSCKRTFREGDLREKYTNEKRLKVVKMYLEGCGIMAIERLEGVPNPLIIQWIRKYSSIIRRKLDDAREAAEKTDVEILELDELFTYCQKKSAECTFGLLLTGTEIKLLTWKSPNQEVRRPICRLPNG